MHTQCNTYAHAHTHACTHARACMRTHTHTHTHRTNMSSCELAEGASSQATGAQLKADGCVLQYLHGRIGQFIVEAPMVLGHETSGCAAAAGLTVLLAGCRLLAAGCWLFLCRAGSCSCLLAAACSMAAPVQGLVPVCCGQASVHQQAAAAALVSVHASRAHLRLEPQRSVE